MYAGQNGVLPPPWRRIRPLDPCAFSFRTRLRMICTVTPAIAAASICVAPSQRAARAINRGACPARLLRRATLRRPGAVYLFVSGMRMAASSRLAPVNQITATSGKRYGSRRTGAGASTLPERLRCAGT